MSSCTAYSGRLVARDGRSSPRFVSLSIWETLMPSARAASRRVSASLPEKSAKILSPFMPRPCGTPTRQKFISDFRRNLFTFWAASSSQLQTAF